MSEFMRPIPFKDLMEWALEEYKNEASIFGIKKEKFYKNESGKMLKTVFGDEISSAVGPAAGPQSQLAQNIIASYLAGARFIELKTVQKLDGEDIQKAVAKPCINSEDECYNCEWSTELTVKEAYNEYVKAYFAIIALAKELNLSDKKDFAYNMSVGYDLEGIKSEKIDTYIENLRNAKDTDVFKECKKYLEENIDKFSNFNKDDLEKISTNICDSITLSTLHGCPAEEIEKIASYLIDDKKISTFIKCNPTMLGYEYARKTLDDMGFDYISFTDYHFKNDLQYEDAVVMIERLLKLAKENNLAFGVKLTNTFPVDVKRNELPAEEMYMSGRSLLPLTVSMAAMLSEKFDGKLPISYSGGADARNIREIFKALGQPITVATTILKPGGYLRFNQLAKETEDLLSGELHDVDVEKTIKLRDNTISEWVNNKLYREKVGSRKTNSTLPLTDCYKAPCKDGGCPIEQQIPEYLKLVANGEYDKAIEVIAMDNTAPTILGKLCAHYCQDHCTRVDYEKSLQIRDMKLIAADKAQDKFVENIKESEIKSDKKVLVIGAGPGGIAVASYLRRNGMDVTVREKLSKPYGIVSHVIPKFRISDEQIERDYQIAVKQGVKFVFDSEVTESYEELKKDYDYIIAATGAWEKGRSPVKEGSENILDALDFLWDVRMNGKANVGKKVAVVGAGDVAMDCTRTAARLDGVESVALVYRRTEAYMPATQEEVNDVKEEGHKIYELVAPYSYDGKVLKCEKMELGEFDESGRRSINSTGEKLDLEFDTVIGATGARVDTSAFKENNINLDDWGNVKTTENYETNIDNVYVIGDCRAGASTIVKAMGEAKAVCLDILAKENLENDFEKFEVKEQNKIIFEKRGRLQEKIQGKNEGYRCLKCNQICEMCTEVCPNRANVAIKVDGFENLHQIIHLDGMCNECGNCGFYCPHAGRPYKDKLTVFWTKEDFDDSTNTGFLKDGNKYLVRLENGKVIETENLDDLSENMQKLIKAIEENYAYYIKPSEILNS
ncbi:MAG: putative selenate reductase subunit YgfK [Anaerococcus vaginalis]|uniref:putative selenate reductase subunit YgfK n=1 Tax=Anaerococcus vaginalis TaxID=33037 RepID=UPI00290F1BF3|nr:putative selenate reductase subunit YgfK [Anaerococcus vaginalis]MDU4378891.1 putative selenate reductase subunit YgfK [Anaerococcus vaginalis]